MTSLDMTWMLGCACMVLLMQAGFACLEAGMVRQKNAANVVLKNLLDFCVAAALFWAVGFGIMFGVGAAHPTLAGWFGTTDFLPGEVTPIGPQLAAFLVFQMMFCGTATTIISGACAERISFFAYVALASVVAAVLYPLFGHWAWASTPAGDAAGWLARLGYHDFAGVGVVHVVGGGIALAACLLVGARSGRFDDVAPGEVAPPIHPSSIPVAALGTMLLLVGWLGFNGGSTLAMDDRVPRVLLNTLLGASGGGIAAMLLSRVLHGFVDPAAVFTGLLAGLVSVTGGADVLSPGGALLAGGIGAVIAVFASRELARLRVDDAVDAVAIHGAAGVWGILAVALLGRGNLLGLDDETTRLSLLGVQAIGAATAVVWAVGTGLGVTWLIGRVTPLRVNATAERIGLNNYEHGHAGQQAVRWTRDDDRYLAADALRILGDDADRRAA